METENKVAKREKKELTPTQQKVKIALNWTVNVLCIILIIFALIMAIFTIVRTTNNDKITRFGDNCYFNVMTDSMKPTFSSNDVIISKYYDGDGSGLKVGQVITFKATVYFGGAAYDSFNTHRIVKITKVGDTVTEIRTRGDNQPADQPQVTWQEAIANESLWGSSERVLPSDVVATWGDVEEVDGQLVFHSGKMLKGVGAFSNWIQHPVSGQTRFFCVVVLPLILLFVIYAFILVRTLIIAKLENAKKNIGESTVTVDSLSDAEKRRLAEEYLASLQAQSAGAPVADEGEQPNATEAQPTADTALDNESSEEAVNEQELVPEEDAPNNTDSEAE